MQIETQSGFTKETDMVTLDGSIDGSNEGKPVGLLFGEALVLDDRNVLGTSDGALDAA